MKTLYKHQQELIDLNPSKWLLSWGCGTGKTLTMVRLARMNSCYTLIICPKSIKEQWKRQVDDREFVVMTKEEFKKSDIKASGLIVDEAHFFTNTKSQLTKKLLSWVQDNKLNCIYLGTATPYLSSVMNIYALGLILGKKWKWWDFKCKYFYDVKMGNRMVPMQKKFYNSKPMEEEVARLIKLLGNTVKLEDCFDVPEQSYEEEYFSLTAEQSGAIKEISLSESNHIVRWTKTHEICGGTLKSDGYTEDRYFKCNKLERLLELIAENDKVIVVCRYNNEINYIKRCIVNRKTYTINGGTKNRHEEISEAEKEKQAVVLVNAACSEGYELPSFALMIFYSYDFSLKNYIQITGRILRANHLKKNLYISLITKDTIDEDVVKCIKSKKNFDVEIYKK